MTVGINKEYKYRYTLNGKIYFFGLDGGSLDY